MRSFMRSANERSPENRLKRLLLRLRIHALRDSLLVFLPPLLAALYAGTYLYRSGWIPPLTLLAASLVATLLALLAVAASYWPRRPTLAGAARLIDKSTAAEDRFITLATVEPTPRLHLFSSRLRHEANEILARVEPRRDFPYRIKPSFYKSLIASSFAIALFHLFLPLLQARTPPAATPEDLFALAQEMVQRPALSELAQKVQTLAAQLQDPHISPEEKQALIEDLQKKVDEQQQREDQEDNRDLLGQAGSTLRGLEQQEGSRQEKQDNANQGAGQIQSNLPQDGQNGGKSSAGTDGSHGDDLRAGLTGDQMQSAQSAQAKSNERQQKEGDGNRPDLDRQQETREKSSSGSEEKTGRSKASEEIPRGAPPAERFYRPGEEGKEGIKGARYVTVQLPEEIAADSKGTTSGTSGEHQNRTRAKVPVSNVPLPAHIPDAPTEKQQIPLEYRGVIR